MVSDLVSLLKGKVGLKAWNYSVLKVALIGIGILLGVYLVDFWRQYLTLVWIITVVTLIWVYIMIADKLQWKK